MNKQSALPGFAEGGLRKLQNPGITNYFAHMLTRPAKPAVSGLATGAPAAYTPPNSSISPTLPIKSSTMNTASLALAFLNVKNAAPMMSFPRHGAPMSRGAISAMQSAPMPSQPRQFSSAGPMVGFPRHGAPVFRSSAPTSSPAADAPAAQVAGGAAPTPAPQATPVAPATSPQPSVPTMAPAATLTQSAKPDTTPVPVSTAPPAAKAFQTPSAQELAMFRRSTGTNFNPHSAMDMKNIGHMRTGGMGQTMNHQQYSALGSRMSPDAGGMLAKGATTKDAALRLFALAENIKSASINFNGPGGWDGSIHPTGGMQASVGMPEGAFTNGTTSGGVPSGGSMKGMPTGPAKFSPGQNVKMPGFMGKLRGMKGMGGLLGQLGVGLGGTLLGNMWGHHRGHEQGMNTGQLQGLQQGAQFAQGQYGQRGVLDRLMDVFRGTGTPDGLTQMLSQIQGMKSASTLDADTLKQLLGRSMGSQNTATGSVLGDAGHMGVNTGLVGGLMGMLPGNSGFMHGAMRGGATGAGTTLGMHGGHFLGELLHTLINKSHMGKAVQTGANSIGGMLGMGLGAAGGAAAGYYGVGDKK